MDQGLDELGSLFSCYRHEQDALNIYYASAILFLYDYCLTFYDEIRFVWDPRRISLSFIAFLFARYPALACTVLILVNPSKNVLAENVATVLKFLAIISSELILAIRTWAIWEKSRMILILLFSVSVCAIIPAGFIIGKDMVTSELGPPIAPQFAQLNQCRIIISSVKHAYIVPYVIAILYETLTLSLSLFKILHWRKSIPTSFRTPLVDALWKDGLLYFSWMMTLSFINIGLVIQTSSPQLRTACAQLQMTIHSILSARIVFHLAKLQDPSNTSNLGHSALTDTAIQFTSRISAGYSSSEYEI